MNVAVLGGSHGAYATAADLTLAEQGQLQLVPSFFVWPGLTALVHKVVEEDEEQLPC